MLICLKQIFFYYNQLLPIFYKRKSCSFKECSFKNYFYVFQKISKYKLGNGNSIKKNNKKKRVFFSKNLKFKLQKKLFI